MTTCNFLDDSRDATESKSQGNYITFKFFNMLKAFHFFGSLFIV